MPTPIEVKSLPGNLIGKFEGRDHGSSISFFVGEFPPGTGPSLHRHPYEETFVIEAGSASFTLGDEALELGAGQIVVVPAGTPHTFVSGEGFRIISISPYDHMEQEDLER